MNIISDHCDTFTKGCFGWEEVQVMDLNAIRLLNALTRVPGCDTIRLRAIVCIRR